MSNADNHEPMGNGDDSFSSQNSYIMHFLRFLEKFPEKNIATDANRVTAYVPKLYLVDSYWQLGKF